MHIHTVVSFLTLNDNIKHVQSKEIIQKAGWFSVCVCVCVCNLYNINLYIILRHILYVKLMYKT